jgi:hypothetical protein
MINHDKPPFVTSINHVVGEDQTLDSGKAYVQTNPTSAIHWVQRYALIALAQKCTKQVKAPHRPNFCVICVQIIPDIQISMMYWSILNVL